MRILTVVGARPNFVKAGPLLREMAKHQGIETILVHTGQHYDEQMSAVFLEDLQLPEPDLNLGVGSGSHAEQTANVMARLEPVLVECAPDLVLVVGDVNSTLAAALTAVKLRIPIAHVEAGVRSFDRTMPEEINRVLTDAVSEILLTPSPEAGDNLRREGVPAERIHFVGNVMVDALLGAMDAAMANEPWRRWELRPGDYAILTLHRPSNVDSVGSLGRIVDAITVLSKQVPVVFPIHPRTAKRLADFDLQKRLNDAPGILTVHPLGYLDFLGLLGRAKLVLTDSGGIQPETSILEVPCLTLRETTEWPETVEKGTNHLVGTDPSEIIGQGGRILRGGERKTIRPELWDGLASERIVEVLLRSE
jgi:UDP-N-acetylglucosamine 2-epimerase (non-hydrolysing)